MGSSEPERARRLRRVAPYAAALILLACTAAVWWTWWQAATRREAAHFQQQIARMTAAIEDRLTDYTRLVLAGAGLVATTEDLTAETWKRFYEDQDVRREFPGVLYVDYAPAIPAEKLDRHVQEVRRLGKPDYSVWPAQDRDLHVPILFLEPFDAGARRVVGFDEASEPVRRAALERARDTGRVILSGKVELLSEEVPVARPGCLLFAPVYRGGSPPADLTERRDRIRGFVLLAFRVEDFVRSTLWTEPETVALRILDESQGVLYEGEPGWTDPSPKRRHHFEESIRLGACGRRWILEFRSVEDRDALADRWASNGILGAGFLISLLCFLFLWALGRTQEQARNLAHERTSALRESASRLRAITDSAHDAILILDHELRVSYWNPAAERLFGFIGEEVIGREVGELLAAQRFRHRILRVLREISETGSAGTFGPVFELTGLKKNGETFPAEVSISAIPVGGHWHTVAVVRDLTERRRAEDERVAREAAEEASRAKSGFVANMSHEIRTPLNAILGFTQILEKDPDLNPRQAESLRTISRSGSHLLGLINDILDMSRIEAGRVALTQAPFCLADLLADLETMFRVRAEEKGLELRVEIDPDLPRQVVGDEGKLRQVLINLLGNAVKFTEKGLVTLRVRARAARKESPEGPSLRLEAEIEDTGPGIPEQDQERIFDPFAQAAAGARAGGTGLGLAISLRFVEMMGGSLRVASQPGQGSCFRFDALVSPALEAEEEPSPSPRRAVGLDPAHRPCRVLVVDDIPTNRALLGAMLRPLGFEVAEAGNGAEALEVFQDWSPHVILMDMRMPVMDGYEATRRLRMTESGRNTPIIAVTASAFEDLRQDVLAAGVDEYLRKPFNLEDLLEILHKCLGLRYLYAEEPPAAPPTGAESPASPGDPRLLGEQLSSLREALADGDMARIRLLLADLPAEPEATRTLKSLADRYDYEGLDSLLKELESGLDPGGS